VSDTGPMGLLFTSSLERLNQFDQIWGEASLGGGVITFVHMKGLKICKQ